MKALVGAFNQEKALEGAFSVIVNFREPSFEDLVCKGLSIYYVSSYNKAGSLRMLTNAYLREQGFIQKLMSYENPH